MDDIFLLIKIVIKNIRFFSCGLLDFIIFCDYIVLED